MGLSSRSRLPDKVQNLTQFTKHMIVLKQLELRNSRFENSFQFKIFLTIICFLMVFTILNYHWIFFLNKLRNVKLTANHDSRPSSMLDIS